MILTRRTGEAVRIEIGENDQGVKEYVWVRVLEVEAGRVRLSFDAPRDVIVLREELLKEREEGR